MGRRAARPCPGARAVPAPDVADIPKIPTFEPRASPQGVVRRRASASVRAPATYSPSDARIGILRAQYDACFAVAIPVKHGE